MLTSFDKGIKTYFKGLTIFCKQRSRREPNLEDLNKKIKSAMFYPSIVIVAMAGVLVVMNLFVIPQLGSLYKDLNLELPLPTKMVLGMS